MIGVGAGQHGLRGVDTYCFGRFHPRVQLCRELTGPAPQVDHATAGNGVTEGDQIVERLPSLGMEALVLIRVPSLDWSHGHQTHV